MIEPSSRPAAILGAAPSIARFHTDRSEEYGTNEVKEAEPRGNRPAKRRYESAIVLGFASVFVVLWILSLSGVRARLATRAWEAGDIEGAYRLATLATRQRPEMADMWLLQARCEDHLESPCEAAISYARAASASSPVSSHASAQPTARESHDLIS